MVQAQTKTVIAIIICILLAANIPTISSSKTSSKGSLADDIDPLLDLNVTIDILSVRGLDPKFSTQAPDFVIFLWINDKPFTSPVWNNTNHLYNPWSVTTDIPDTNETVSFRLSLYNNNDSTPEQCDLSATPNSGDEGYSIDLQYNVKTGHWNGDDHLGDASGYGRANGCDDGSVYKSENDCELTFTIYANDFDNDGIPYWTEVNEYGTDPTIDNRGEDTDMDLLPIEYEFLWGYNPLIADNHSILDPDNDSISNLEEYYTWSFGSDPFRQDLFLEMDYMDTGPNGEKSIVPEDAREQLKDPFARRNIVFHFDTGEINGGELIPFDSLVNIDEVIPLYKQYFLHNDSTTWRRGVFHYGIYVYSTKPNGFGFSGDVEPFMGYLPGTNAFIISSRMMEKHARWPFHTLAYYYASSTMHEMGHTMGLRNGHPPGCDAFMSGSPWQPNYWIYRTYKSIMNYHYTYWYFDYSDGTHGVRDSNDWANLSLSHFEIPTVY